MAKNILTSVVTVLLMLMLLELGAGIYLKDRNTQFLLNRSDYFPPGSKFIFDKEVGYKLKPYYRSQDISVNNLGFRSSKDFDSSNTFEKKKVLLLGDSMVFGIDCPQDGIFSEILNRQLPGYLFVNTGVAGYDLLQEYLVLKRYVDVIKPELVLLFFFQPNDMWHIIRKDDFKPHSFIKDKEFFISEVEDKVNLKFYKKSKLYQLVVFDWLRGRDLFYLWEYLDFYIFTEKSYVWRVTDEIIRRIGGLSQQKKFKVVVFDIQGPYPRGLKTRRKLLRQAVHRENFLYYELDRYYPSDPGKLFLPDKVHWNKEGHEFVAGIIKDNLRHFYQWTSF